MNHHPSPSTSSSSSGSTSTVRPLQINLKSHCLLCLSPESPSILQRLQLQNPRNLLNFQPLVYYLTAIDPTSQSTSTPSSPLSPSKNYLPVFANLPPLCQSCYELVSELYQLHLQLVDVQVRLQRNIALCRRIVRSTCRDDKPGGRLANRRSQFFKQMGTGLRSHLSREEMEGLRYFLENFQGLVVAAEDKYVFPSPVPPKDPYASKSSRSPPPPSSTSNLLNLSYPVQFLPPEEASLQLSPPPQLSPEEYHGSRNSELIVVSGNDHNLKYESDEDDPLGEAEEENPVNAVVLFKEDLEEPETDNQYQYFKEEEEDDVETAISPLAVTNEPSWKTREQPCDVCNLPLPLPQLATHMKQHLGRNGWVCDKCHRVFLSRSRLIQHFTSDPVGILCAQTSPCFRHLSHVCTVCSTQFLTEVDLHSHLFGIHEQSSTLIAKWKCGVCGWRGKSEQGLDFHFNVHLYSPQNIVPGGWQQVPSPTSTHENFKEKRKRKSNAVERGMLGLGELDFTCDLCGKKCCGGTALLRHVKEVHKGSARRKVSSSNSLTANKHQ